MAEITKSGSRSFLFLLVSEKGKDIKEGDELGRAIVGWQKGMGERGRIGEGERGLEQSEAKAAYRPLLCSYSSARRFAPRFAPRLSQVLGL